MRDQLDQVLVIGGGLAGWMAASALAHNLPNSYRITLLNVEGTDKHDLFFGNVSAPSGYSFNLAAGVSEPDLFLGSSASFSFGTQYQSWGAANRSWMQCHHLPLPVFGGLPFTQLFHLSERDLEAYFISAQAALHGRFAHPPSDSKNPLSRAEYGYQFDPFELAGLFRKSAKHAGVRILITSTAEVVLTNRDNSDVECVVLADGKRVTADFYIDCTGPDSDTANVQGRPHICATLSREAGSHLGPPMRIVRGTTTGWEAKTFLQGKSLSLKVFDETNADCIKPDGADDNVEIGTAFLGSRPDPWRGNCVSIGHAAGVIEPITPAPMMLLQRGIERLLQLFPVSQDMSIEARAYNEGHSADFEHAQIFNHALFAVDDLLDGPYWSAKRALPMNKKLDRKLKQFESRGLFVAYDLEPFNEQDWAILHFGMGRTPRRSDVFADFVNQAQIKTELDNLVNSVDTTVQKIPPHHIYMDKFLSYLERKKTSHV